MSSRKSIIIGNSVVAFVSSLIIVLIPGKTVNYWLGVLAGVILGLVTVVYMIYAKVVDFEEAQLSRKERMESPWLLISVIGGLLLARVIFYFIDPQYEIALINCAFSWLALTFGYGAFKVWKDSPRQ
jgi:ABC-type Na+ efflux pump permease subunit